MKITEINAETGVTIEREPTAEELVQFELDQAAEAELKTNAELRAEQKAGLLQRLGITAEEAELLLS